MLSALACATTAVYIRDDSMGAVQPRSAEATVAAKAIVAARDEQQNPTGLKVSKSRPMTLDDVHAFEDAPGTADPTRVKDDAGNSARLGNLIDLWWYELTFPNVPRQLASEDMVYGQYERIIDQPRNTLYSFTNDFGWETRTVFSTQCPVSKKCFGRYLWRTVRPGTEPNIKVKSLHPDARLSANMSDRFEKLKPIMHFDYAMYRADVVRDYMVPALTHDVAAAFHAYATENAPELLQPPTHDAVVHYRLGDALRNELPIAPESIAAALASLNPQPKTIEVLSGGFNFGGNATLALPKIRTRASAHFLKLLADAILKVLPDAQVTMPTRKSAATSTIDGDWAKLVQAKSMVAGAGSFGLSAAAARDHSDPTKQTRTPAYFNGIYPCSMSHYFSNHRIIDDASLFESQMQDAMKIMNETDLASSQEGPSKVSTKLTGPTLVTKLPSRNSLCRPRPSQLCLVCPHPI
jgi:hypothetical protein